MNLERILIIAIFVLTSLIQVRGNLIRNVYTEGPEYGTYIHIGNDLRHERVLRFSVRTPRDARILLVTSPQDSKPVYEVVLGARDNTINFIHDSKYSDDDEPKAVVRTVNLLSQQEFRNFWIRLKDDSEENNSKILQVGIGDEDTPFLEWRDKRRFTPGFMSFRSEVPAEWRWGYIDETYTEALYSGHKSIVITMPRNYYPGAQYFPLSELASHSENGLTLRLRISSRHPVNIVLSPTVGLDDWMTFGVDKDSVSFSQTRGNTAHRSRFLIKDGLGTAKNPYVDYWMNLTQDGLVMIGNYNSKRPIQRWETTTSSNPQFVSFSLPIVYETEYDSTITSTIWFVSEPTDDSRPPTQDCTPRWKEARKQELPSGAVRGGYNDRDEIFVCRASHYGLMLPGSFILENRGKGSCHISMGIEVIKKTTFQVLTGCKFDWVAASLGDIPEDAISAGRNVGNEIIYAARVSYGGQLMIGKLHSNQRIAYVTFNNQVIPSTNYELLMKGEYDWAQG